MESKAKGAVRRRVDFRNRPDWRWVIHAIQQTTGRSQADLAAVAKVSQTAVSELYLRVTSEPRYHLGRTLERLYERIPSRELEKVQPIGEPEPRGMRGRRGKGAREALLALRHGTESANADRLCADATEPSAA